MPQARGYCNVNLESLYYADDTGARHQGRNGYCTHIGNELFAWFESTASKSRINFLELLRHGHTDYVLSEDALAYMSAQNLAKTVIEKLETHCCSSVAKSANMCHLIMDT